jgi:hypothetical protein
MSCRIFIIEFLLSRSNVELYTSIYWKVSSYKFQIALINNWRNSWHFNEDNHSVESTSTSTILFQWALVGYVLIRWRETTFSLIHRCLQLDYHMARTRAFSLCKDLSNFIVFKYSHMNPKTKSNKKSLLYACTPVTYSFLFCSASY